jgi:hypothetical protein
MTSFSEPIITFTSPALLPYYISEGISYFAFVGVAYLAWRIVRAYERRSLEPDQLRAFARRIESLEAAVGTVEDQVRQTAEAQHFTTTLLTGRSGENTARSG